MPSNGRSLTYCSQDKSIHKFKLTKTDSSVQDHTHTIWCQRMRGHKFSFGSDGNTVHRCNRLLWSSSLMKTLFSWLWSILVHIIESIYLFCYAIFCQPSVYPLASLSSLSVLLTRPLRRAWHGTQSGWQSDLTTTPNTHTPHPPTHTPHNATHTPHPLSWPWPARWTPVSRGQIRINYSPKIKQSENNK